MHAPDVAIRRGRREDFTAVMALLARAGAPVPPPDRAALRRFRRIATDLGSDFYVAEVGGELAGFVYITYARQLAGGAQARIESLLAAAERRAEIESRLLALAAERARKRACARLCWVPSPTGAISPAAAAAAGLRPGGTQYCRDCDGQDPSHAPPASHGQGAGGF